MEAGRELDAMVAEKVMGLRICRDYGFQDNHVIVNDKDLFIDEIPRFSIKVSDAWLVVEKMITLGWLMELKVLWPSNRYGVQLNSDNDSVLEFAPAAPHAICLAALKAVGALE